MKSLQKAYKVLQIGQVQVLLLLPRTFDIQGLCLQISSNAVRASCLAAKHYFSAKTSLKNEKGVLKVVKASANFPPFMKDSSFLYNFYFLQARSVLFYFVCKYQKRENNGLAVQKTQKSSQKKNIHCSQNTTFYEVFQLSIKSFTIPFFLSPKPKPTYRSGIMMTYTQKETTTIKFAFKPKNNNVNKHNKPLLTCNHE